MKMYPEYLLILYRCIFNRDYMKKIILFMILTGIMAGCNSGQENRESFNYTADRFADIEVLRYQVPGFEQLNLQQKQLLFHLSEAALMGRDMLFDQNNRYNLAIRRALEAVYQNYNGNKENTDFKALEIYLKRVWFASGIHHHYAEDKFTPGFSSVFFEQSIRQLDVSLLPLREGQTVDFWLEEIVPVIFHPEVMPKRSVQSGEQDLIAVSANNYYGEGVTMNEVEDFYATQKDPNDPRPISYGLNSRLVKENGRLVEKVWKVG